MKDHELKMTIVLNLGTDEDHTELDRHTRQVLREIKQLDFLSAALTGDGDVTPGTKGDPVTIGTIFVSLASAGVLTALVELLKAWALRGENRKITIKANIDNQEIELEYSPIKVSQEELLIFVATLKELLQKK